MPVYIVCPRQGGCIRDPVISVVNSLMPLTPFVNRKIAQTCNLICRMLTLYSNKTRKAGTTGMKIQKSAEDYLEAMLIMKERHGYIRSVDLAEHLGVTKPSVSYAVKRLRENGYISMQKGGEITLLEPGMEIASRIYERHTCLTAFLTGIGVDAETAQKDACRIEHDLSEETFQAIREYAAKQKKA